MLGITIAEFFGRLIPEVLILIFASYAFSKTRINQQKYIVSACILGVCVFIIRFLPISYGVHTILNIIALGIITTNINKIDIIGAIKACIITPILLFILEGINVILLRITVADKLDLIVADATLKTIYTIPSLLGFILIVWIYYMKMKKENKLKDV